MATYRELCELYRKRQKDGVIDMVAAGLSHADEFAVDLGLLDAFGSVAEVLNQISLALPFVIIVATEGTRVVLGHKRGSSGAKDAAYRTLKSGAAIAVGAGVAAVAGSVAAIPAAITVRLVFDRYRSRALLGRRMADRTESMRFLGDKWKKKSVPAPLIVHELPLLPAPV